MNQSFVNRLAVMKRNGVNILYVLDIGAYRGEFTNIVKSLWSAAIVKQIEADDRQAQYLQKDAIFTLLGDEEKEVDFYTLSEDKITTGSSIYKEITNHYNDQSTIVLKKQMVTLDSLDEKYNFFGKWNTHGLVKIDTQGSEIIILKGAKNFLERKKPKYILLECPVIEYNKGAPTLVEYINTMNALGYALKDIFDMSYNNKSELLQFDILFERC